jgi:hypothetical protein
MSHSHKPIEEIDKKILEDLIDLLFFQYPKARESIISFESHANEMPVYAFTELRDFIDHINLAIRQDLSSKEIPHHLAQAEEHLRRAVAEPYQGMVQEELKEIVNLFGKYNASWFKKIPFVQAKLIQYDEYYKKQREIHDLLEKGRKLKSCNIWSDDFDEAIQNCFLPALEKSISLKQTLIEAMEVSKERKERIVLVLIGGLFFNAIIFGLKFFCQWIFK